MGGYPAASGYRFEAHGTNLKERIEKRLPIPTGGDTDPDNPKYDHLMEAKEIIRDKQAITTETIFENYDLYLNYLRGGPGFGDPLERNPKMIEDDLNEGHLLPRYAESVYGAVVSQNEKGKYIVDEKATDKRRKEMRKERLKRGLPVKEWIKQERQKVINKEAAVQVRHMYAGSFALRIKRTKVYKRDCLIRS